ncbi:MAG: hypothetical protein ACREMG_05690, partial [Gemmatimonadales bacterium]
TQVTLLWRPSDTETNPDPFFGVAGSPLTPAGGVNPLYDPNFRGFDVEGYRVYRGRTSNPSQLTLVAQFDYAPDPTTGRGIMNDFLATVNPAAGCAPELAVTTTCPITFSTPPPGTAFTDSVPVDLTGTVTQVIRGDRVKLFDGNAQILPGKLDTAFADVSRGRLAVGVSTNLANTGVPFVFVDRTVRNSVRYFYSVTAFDINSRSSGPSSLESARNTKAVTPVAAPTNSVSSATITGGVFGRDSELTGTTVPALDPVTGRFSGPFPPANNQSLGFVGEFARQLFSTGGSVKIRLDGIGLGDQRDGVPARYTFTASAPGIAPSTISLELDPTFAFGNPTLSSPPFPAALADPTLAARFGAPAGPVSIAGQVTFGMPNYQRVVGQVRGCADGGLDAAGATVNCNYNGPRWFAGANETQDNPNAGMSTDFSGDVPGADLNNAGALPGVVTIYTPMTLGNISNAWRAMDASTGGAGRAADFNVYWGNPGKIDSIIDVTHNVPVPFMRDSAGGGFGVLNVSGSSAAGSDDGRAGVV